MKNHYQLELDLNFDSDCKEVSLSDYSEFLRSGRKLYYRVKTIKSGNMLESEIYPIWNIKKLTRKERQKITRQTQQNLNNKNAAKKISRLINTNFTEKDLAVTLTYDNVNIVTAEQAKRDIQNYIRRIKNFRKKNNLPEMKYIYVIESDKVRVHHHLVLSGGMDRDAIEKIWGKGFANCRRLQADEFGFEALARYMVKESGKDFKKRWCGSRNLKPPQVFISDRQLSKKKLDKIIKDNNQKAFFEKFYKNFLFNDSKITYNDFTSCFSLYVRMRRNNERTTKVRRM